MSTLIESLERQINRLEAKHGSEELYVKDLMLGSPCQQAPSLLKVSLAGMRNPLIRVQSQCLGMQGLGSGT